MRTKIEQVLASGWPFLVAERDGNVIGYAYATQIRERPAYAFTCKNSIYVADGHTGKGVGRGLLSALIACAEQAGFRQMIAVIGGGSPASVGLHETFGFKEAGRLTAVGRKNHRWLDTVYMQRPIGTGNEIPPEREPS